MTNFFHVKLAKSNIKNNKRITLPYILSSTFMVMIFYIIISLRNNDSLQSVSTKTMLGFGIYVMGFFIAVFLFYTYSFITKKRIKELGLYAVLGMTKSNISKIVFIETVINYFLTTTLGIIIGIVFDKIAYLSLIKLIKGEVKLGFHISFQAIIVTILFFAVIYILIVLSTLIKIYRLSIINLMKEEKTAEKEPKTRWLLVLVGVALLAYGYYTALTIKTPLSAVSNFFYAVMAVIIGTYLLFIAISIFVLKILKNNKNYYYKTKNFISVSSMLYRMKRNAVGLASICILSTMSLVTLGSTTSLYTATEDFVNQTFPREVVISAYNSNEEKVAYIKDVKNEVLEKHKIKEKDELLYTFVYAVGLKKDGGLQLEKGNTNLGAGLSKLASIVVVSLDEYNKNNNKNETLQENEILFKDLRNKTIDKTFTIHDKTYTIKKDIESIENIGNTGQNITDTYYIVVKDKEELNRVEKIAVRAIHQTDKVDDYAMKQTFYAFNLSTTKQEIIEKITGEIKVGATKHKDYEKFGNFFDIENRATGAKEIRTVYASFLFIGIFISMVFISSQVVIMYYKQITEGYDDKDKFAIMQKVGLEDNEIKNSIKSQVLIVFFSPLVVALIHVAVAYPFIEKVLRLFNLAHATVFLYTMLVTSVIFTLFYYIVYSVTSRVYYNVIKK